MGYYPCTTPEECDVLWHVNPQNCAGARRGGEEEFPAPEVPNWLLWAIRDGRPSLSDHQAAEWARRMEPLLTLKREYVERIARNGGYPCCEHCGCEDDEGYEDKFHEECWECEECD